MTKLKNITIIAAITIGFAFLSLAQSDEQLSDQMLINRTMLLTGSDETVRIVAARQMLIDSGEPVRQAVIDILAGENDDAVAAVCNAIIQSPDWNTEGKPLGAYIDPLVDILTAREGQLAVLAAEALAVYPYEEVKPKIEDILYDPEANENARLNIMRKLSLRLSDKDVIESFIRLLDDENETVAEHAGRILQAWVPMGVNKDLWDTVRDELRRKSPDEIVRERLVAQEAKIEQFENRLKQLENRNKSLLDELTATYEQMYQARNDEQARSLFLQDALKKEIDELRLWAVRKVVQWRNSNDVPRDLAVAVADVLSDRNQSVRLEAANLMVYMADTNPAQKLKQQLERENNPQVQSALLESLSESTYFALLPSSNIEVVPEIRIFTLDKAAEMLKENSNDRVILAAEVMRKQLERNGLDNDQVRAYIQAVIDRYRIALDGNGQLAARILSIASRFCLGDFHYRNIAREMLKGEFENALNSTNSAIRIAAVNGLINSDRVAALRTLTDRQLYNDPDDAVSKRVIDLARDVGTSRDYKWLIEKGRQNSDNVWPAVTAILQREDVELVERAIENIDTYDISDERKIEIYEIGRKKAGIQYKSTIKLAQFYISRERYADAAELYKVLINDAAGKSVAFEDAVNAANSFITADDKDGLVLLIGGILEGRDIDSDSELANLLSNAAANEQGGLKEKLINISAPQERPGWRRLVEQWKPQPEPEPEPEPEPQPEPKPAAEAEGEPEPEQQESENNEQE